MAHLKLSQTYKMELSEKVYGWEPLTIFAKSSILDVDWGLNMPLQVTHYQVNTVPARFEIIIAIFSGFCFILFSYLLKISYARSLI